MAPENLTLGSSSPSSSQYSPSATQLLMALASLMLRYVCSQLALVGKTLRNAHQSSLITVEQLASPSWLRSCSYRTSSRDASRVRDAMNRRYTDARVPHCLYKQPHPLLWDDQLQQKAKSEI